MLSARTAPVICRGVGVVFEVERQHVVEERCQPKGFRVARSRSVTRARRAARSVTEVRPRNSEDGSPGLIGRRGLDLDGCADDGADAPRGRQPEPLVHKPRLADAGLTFEPMSEPFPRRARPGRQPRPRAPRSGR